MRWLHHISVLGGLALLTNANQAICDRRDCQSVIKTLSQIHASPFCSEFLGIKTSTRTVTAKATNVKTKTITTTTSINVPITASTTEVAAIAVTTTATNVVIMTPPAVTATVTTTASTDTTQTVTTTSTSTICTGGGVMKREALPTSPKLETRNAIPKALQCYNRQQIYNACNCYLTSKTPKIITKAITVTTQQTKTATMVVSATVSTAVATNVISSTSLYPTTVVFDITDTLEPETQTETVTTTTTATSVTTEVVPTTTNISQDYTSVFTGDGCVYNEYSDYFVLAAPNFADAEQQCACKCNQSPSCTSFFIYYSPPNGRFGEEYDCTLDSVPFDPSFVQCNVYFAAQAKAYNNLI